MKKQKKAIVASILASATMLTITAAASTQNISAYTEAKDIIINSIAEVDPNYYTKYASKAIDENGEVVAEITDIGSFYINDEFYVATPSEATYYFENETYSICPEDKVAIRRNDPADDVYEEEDETLSQSYLKFISVFIDTMVPNDAKSQFKKSSDGTITVELNKNQIPELIVLGFDVMCEEYIQDVEGGHYSDEFDPIFTSINDATLEGISLQIKATNGLCETLIGKAKISGVDDSGNAVAYTMTAESASTPNGDTTMQLPDLTGYKVFDEDATFEGTAIFTKGSQTYEVTAEEADNSVIDAYFQAAYKANIYEDYGYIERFNYFDSVTLSDGTDAYEQH